MKKKVMIGIITAVVVAFVVIGAIWGRDYYQKRYVGSDYYAMIPIDFDLTPQTLYDMDGKEAGVGKNYVLTAYNEQGEAKTVDFDIRSDDTSKYPKPGTFLYVKASEELVIGWSVTTESNIPEKALEKIKNN